MLGGGGGGAGPPPLASTASELLPSDLSGAAGRLATALFAAGVWKESGEASACAGRRRYLLPSNVPAWRSLEPGAGVPAREKRGVEGVAASRGAGEDLGAPACQSSGGWDGWGGVKNHSLLSSPVKSSARSCQLQHHTESLKKPQWSAKQSLFAACLLFQALRKWRTEHGSRRWAPGALLRVHHGKPSIPECGVTLLPYTLCCTVPAHSSPTADHGPAPAPGNWGQAEDRSCPATGARGRHPLHGHTGTPLYAATEPTH